MDVRKVKEKVNCCACGEPMKSSKHINMVGLDKRATWEYPSWGVMSASHSYEPLRACAILCDNCVKRGKLPRFAVEWSENCETVEYHPIDDLEDLPQKPKKEALGSEWNL